MHNVGLEPHFCKRQPRISLNETNLSKSGSFKWEGSVLDSQLLGSFCKRSYRRKLSTRTSSRHKPEIACVVKSTWRWADT